MKKLFTLIMVTLITLSALTQAPQKMSYQCVVRNSSGVLVTKQSVGIRISILQGTSSGAVIYQEIYNPNPQTNANGLVSMEIGGGVPIIGIFSAIDWSSGMYFLKTETDPAGGINYTIIGTSQLLSVPYALYAKTAGNALSGNYNDLINKPILFSGNYNDLTNRPTLFNGSWANITGKPNSLAGYGITDAVNTTGNQTITGNKAFTGIISASSQNITNVANPVNAQDAATKDYVDAMQTKITMLKNTLKAGGIVTDIDGNSYNTVVIGTQTWMAENLKTTKYNDGTPIPLVTDNTAWSTLTSPGYCWYNNDEAIYKATYGALYNWYVVDPTSNGGKNVCPTGWHVPSINESDILFYLVKVYDTPYMEYIIIGNELMETGTTHWIESWGTNETGFTSLPGGIRYSTGICSYIGRAGNFWCSGRITQGDRGYYLEIPASVVYHTTPTQISSKMGNGLSIRCLKD